MKNTKVTAVIDGILKLISPHRRPHTAGICTRGFIHTHTRRCWVVWTRAAATVLCESEFTTLNSLRFASRRGVETIYSALQINKHLTSPHKTCVCMCVQMFPNGIVEIMSSQIRASNNPVKLSPHLLTLLLSCLLPVHSHAHYTHSPFAGLQSFSQPW